MSTPSVLSFPLAALVEGHAADAEDELLSATRKHLKLFLEMSLELELTQKLGVSRYRRESSRQDYRNGHYTRDFATTVGLIEKLRVPRCRGGGFQPSLFARYQRRQQKVEELMRTLFFLGVSTRGVGEALEMLLGIAPSAASVSAVAAKLDEEVKAFHQRPLKQPYVYLFLDGVTMTVKEAPRAVKRLVLVAYGITPDGRKELIDYHVAKSESQAEWENFLNRLVARGLSAAPLQLITTDGGAGLLAALEVVFGLTRRQRCWVHKMRNIAHTLKKSQETECLRGLVPIYTAKTYSAARAAYQQWEKRWQPEAPAAVSCLAADLEEMLAFLCCPRAHHKLIRTTNCIERLFLEVRRRTKLMGAFANRASCDRLLFGILTRIDRRWSKRPLPAFTHQS